MKKKRENRIGSTTHFFSIGRLLCVRRDEGLKDVKEEEEKGGANNHICSITDGGNEVDCVCLAKQ